MRLVKFNTDRTIRHARRGRPPLWRAIAGMALLALAARADAAENIRAASDHNYPPYEFLDDQGQPTGFNVDLFREVCEVMDIRPSIRLDTWTAALRRLEDGEADVMIGMYYSAERSRKFIFSAPFISVAHAIFTRRDSPIKGLEDLKGREVIVQQGDIMHDFLLGQSLSLNIIAVNDPIDALRLLADGRHDCALLAKLPALYLINKHGLDGLRPAGPAIHQTDYCFAGRKGGESLLARLDEGLLLLRASGRYQQIHDRWFGGYTRRGAIGEAARYLLIFLAPIGLLLLAILAWAHTLRRRIAAATAGLRVELTQRQAAEQALHHREEHLRITLESIGDAVIATNAAGQVARMNLVAQRLTGWTLAEAEGRPLGEIIKIVNAQTRAAMPDPVAKVLKDGKIVGLANHTTLIGRHGAEYQIADSAAPIQDANGDIFGVVLVFRDITAQYRLERELRDSERQLRELFTNSLSAIAIHEIVLDAQGRPADYIFLKANPAFETHTGLKLKDVLGKRVTQIHPGIEKTHLIATYGKVALTGEPAAFEIFFEPSQRHYQVSACQVGQNRFAAFFWDITAPKKQELALRENARILKELLAEKEVLLREVHHRVKNNLAVIVGLINLQQHAPGRLPDAALLPELGRRIRAIAILHEMLYQSENLSKIKLQEYFQSLAASLRESFAIRDGVQILVDAGEITVSLDTAVPCGLIVNELVTNAFKHAFPAGAARPPGAPPPVIKVQAAQANGECLLTVADNGCGLPAGMDWSASPTLGLRLVSMLAQKQLQGAIEVDRAAGTVFRIRFKL